MLILSIDQSTPAGSAAILRDADVLAEHTWSEGDARNHRIFALLPRMLADAGLRLPDMDLYAVGRGPGAFSGIRMSISAVQGMALPGKTPVQALPSCEAIAWDVWTETRLTPIAIAGDARRSRLWLAVFHATDAGLRLARPVALVPTAEAADALRESAVAASPDWNRIGADLNRAAPVGVRILAEDRVPRARVVGELARQRVLAGTQSDPCTPLYLHPSVFVEPRFEGT